MNKDLILNAFAKAEQEIKKRGVLKPSLTQMATELSAFIEEKENFILGERSLRDYRGDALKLDDDESDISIKQIAVINGLCQYLGFHNYQEFFQNKNSKRVEPQPDMIKSKPNYSQVVKLFIAASTIVFIAFLIYKYSHRQRWMVWQKDHYVEVNFDAKKYGVRNLKLYKEDRVLSFNKVKVSCDTIFFNNDNSVRFWYGKNKSKEIEYFTDLGLHPETGRTLKPITDYMINKYVCVDEL